MDVRCPKCGDWTAEDPIGGHWCQNWSCGHVSLPELITGPRKPTTSSNDLEYLQKVQQAEKIVQHTKELASIDRQERARQKELDKLKLEIHELKNLLMEALIEIELLEDAL